MADTEIQWTQKVWNPVRGCSRISAGCDHCYAMGQAHRFSGEGGAYEGLTVLRPKTAKRPGVDWSGRVRLVPEMLDVPRRWRTPQLIFVDSMGDPFHESLGWERDIDRIFEVMESLQHHTFQLLTKRARNMRDYCHDRYRRTQALPPKNIWLGVSVEDQAAADERIPHLLELTGYTKFISAEPLLGPLNLHPFLCRNGRTERPEQKWASVCDARPDGLNWVIVGGESGPKARPCALEWIQSVVDQCRAAEVPVFVKQLGAFVVSEERAFLREDLELGTDEEAKAFGFNSRWLWRAGLADKKGGDIAEWPSELQVRQFPETRNKLSSERVEGEHV